MALRPLPSDLPIAVLLPQIRDTLRQSTSLVLQAPPGAGKTTLVPLALLDEGWLGDRRIVMLEPRRLAARAAAKRMADLLGQRVGQTVGYRVRLDSAIGPETRIEVVTAGIFIRQIQDDPSLEGTAAVIFDEFHERSLDVDLGLALCLDARATLRQDLRVVAMSATLAGEPISALLEPGANAPILVSEGRQYPVDTRYLSRDPTARLDETTASAIRSALSSETGDLLVFLPGVGDIRRVQTRLEGFVPASADVTPLYSDLSLERQDAAIRPSSAGRRKIVLATSIAETSLTIEGVRVVIDSGYMRLPRFDVRTGMSTLETVRVSRASADQRRGRAGRLGPGVCYRLWTEAADRALPPQTPPEMFGSDLAPLALELAAWGVADAKRLLWLDPPPDVPLASARDLLRRLGAIDAAGTTTDEGRRMVKLGAHPRLAHMLLRGHALGLGALAADVAALLGERDILRDGNRDADLAHRVELLHGRARAAQAVAQVATQWRRQLGIPEREVRLSTVGLGRLVALAYPDRIAQRRPNAPGQFRLSNGRGAILPATDPLASHDFLAAAALDGSGPSARIFLAAPIEEGELRQTFAEQIRDVEFVEWDSREGAVKARHQRKLGELVLDDKPADPDPDAVAAAMLDGIRQLGLDALPWTKELRDLQCRIAFLRRLEGDEWPDLSDAALLATLDTWLAPYLIGITRQAHLERIDLSKALIGQLPWERQQALSREAPTHWIAPTGSRVRIDYSGEQPSIAIRLQELFGLGHTPSVANGRITLLIHLLSPANRPVQVTRDLASFWANGYRDVRRDLRGQYPKHFWPEDPLTAAPTHRAKPRGGRS